MRIGAAPKRRCAEARAISTVNVFDDTSDACAHLAGQERAFAHALSVIQQPHIRRRPGGFEAVFRIIVEQQVSVASAQAIWSRCLAGIDPLTPQTVLNMGEGGLKQFGLSGPKARYVMGLAQAVDEKAISFGAIEGLANDEASAALQSLKGIGPWTAAIYLLFCEGRIDIWPARDVALLAAWRDARSAACLRRGPKPDMAGLDLRAAKWRPYRGIAAHILWTYYASIRGRTPI